MLRRMARPLRIEFPGALYHVTTRGDRRETVYEDDADRERFLALLGEVVGAFNWVVHAYCLMDNHYHLLVETPDGNLSRGMRQLNGVYTQWSNRRHGRTGHLFQGRYKAVLVDADEYLLELTRYVVLNPVRAGMVRAPGDWPWSSYRATQGDVPCPPWLAADAVLSHFGSRRSRARAAYAKFVAEGVGATPVWEGLRGQVYLGDERFMKRMLARTGRAGDINVPRAQRRASPPRLATIARKYRDRNEAMAAAWATGGYSYAEIARHFGVHFTTVGRAVRAARQARER